MNQAISTLASLGQQLPTSHLFTQPTPALIDLAIIALAILYLLSGWQKGAGGLLADFLSFLASLLLALRLYPLPAHPIYTHFPLPTFLANALGFLLIAILFQLLFSYLFHFLVRFIPPHLEYSFLSRIFALPLSLGSAILLVAFFLLLLVAAPVNPHIKTAILNTQIGAPLVLATTYIQQATFRLIGNSPPKDNLTFFALPPDSAQHIELRFSAPRSTPDPTSQSQLLYLINHKRQQLHLPPLSTHPALVQAAQTHAQELFHNGYLSHTNLGDQTPTQRVGEIGFSQITEIILLSPTASFAHQGLHDSSTNKHLFTPQVTHIGIGVVDGDIYGKAFVILLAQK